VKTAVIIDMLTNEAMEGLVKTVRTTTSVEQRIKELDNTSMPLPFQFFFAGEWTDSASDQSNLHKGIAENGFAIIYSFLESTPIRFARR
jgi:hypothetical protein